MTISQTFYENPWIAQLLVSCGLVGVAFLLRWLLRRAVNTQHSASAELRRRWLLQIRNVTFTLIAVGLVLIWATELKTAAISVVAIVAALVIATKELLLCLTGGFLKISSRIFVLGDHIEVGTVRGEVIDQTLMTTKLMESTAGPNGNQYTGRTVSVPNALFLSQPVYNETLTKQFGLYVMTVPVKADAAWEEHEQALIEAMRQACEPFLAKASAAVDALAYEEGLNAPSVEPRVQITIPEPGRVNLVARLPYPVDQKSKVVQQVLRLYLRQVATIAPVDKPADKPAGEADTADGGMI